MQLLLRKFTGSSTMCAINRMHFLLSKEDRLATMWNQYIYIYIIEFGLFEWLTGKMRLANGLFAHNLPRDRFQNVGWKYYWPNVERRSDAADCERSLRVAVPCTVPEAVDRPPFWRILICRKSYRSVSITRQDMLQML